MFLIFQTDQKLANTLKIITIYDVFVFREVIREKYESKIEKEMSGPEFEIISRIMKTLVQRRITVPGTFKG